MAAVAKDCPPQHTMDQAELAKPTLAKMDSSSALEGVVSSTVPLTVSTHCQRPCVRAGVATPPIPPTLAVWCARAPAARCALRLRWRVGLSACQGTSSC